MAKEGRTEKHGRAEGQLRVRESSVGQRRARQKARAREGGTRGQVSARESRARESRVMEVRQGAGQGIAG